MNKQLPASLDAHLTPRQIVAELDKYIIGQPEAKRSVAIALRNRWRRMQLDETMANEISPKNILMIGPTGVGKTEIARRLAKLSGAPFLKVEATKFTEVGYVGREVDSIIKDLVDIAMKNARANALLQVTDEAEQLAEDRVLDILLRPAEPTDTADVWKKTDDTNTRQIMRKKLREGGFDDREITVELSQSPVNIEVMLPPGMEEMSGQFQKMFSSLHAKKTNERTMLVKDSLKALQDEEAINLLDEDEIKHIALQQAEQNGIVFLDEIDKIAGGHDRSSAQVSREGVQRDLLPLIEGSVVTTKYGMVHTDHILFIASGAFQMSKPSDLIPELQGRLPIRVELKPLMPDDFERILTEPDFSLTKQYKELLSTEGLQLEFSDEAVREIAEIAFAINERVENIGARRLHTLMEKLLESVSFAADSYQSTTGSNAVAVDVAYVREQLEEISVDEDLSRYIL